MAGRRKRGPNADGPKGRERDLRDIEVDDLRRQVQQLTERLQRLEPVVRNGNVSEGDSSDKETNPFHNGDNEESSEDEPTNRQRRPNVRSHDFKVDIPDFDGRNDPDEFIDWLNSIERVFEFNDVPEDRKVKLVAIKLKKHASIWWEHLRRRREREGRGKIRTWEKMKRELRRKFLPDNYRQDAFLKYHNLKQKELSVEDYVAEFECLMMRCDIVEQEEQTIARFLGGLRYDICNVVQLQPYCTYNDVCKLDRKVEKQQKESSQSGF